MKAQPYSLAKFSVSIEQLVMMIDELERRIERLERMAKVHETRDGRRRTRALEIENHRRWQGAMDAFISGDRDALKRFEIQGGWTPPKEYR